MFNDKKLQEPEFRSYCKYFRAISNINHYNITMKFLDILQKEFQRQPKSNLKHIKSKSVHQLQILIIRMNI